MPKRAITFVDRHILDWHRIPEETLRRRERKRAYHLAISSPHWQQLRAEKCPLTGGACEGCGCRHRQLELHHKHYRTLVRESLDDVVLLCSAYHITAHIAESEREAF